MLSDLQSTPSLNLSYPVRLYLSINDSSLPEDQHIRLPSYNTKESNDGH